MSMETTNRDLFSASMEDAIWGRRLEPMAVLEIQDLNNIITVEEVKAAIIRYWNLARIHRRFKLTKCFRLFSFDHLQANCRVPDRRGKVLCCKCGKVGHRRNGPKAKARRCLSPGLKVSPKHISGTRACSVFQKALEKNH
ncbi:hypothetical protein J6590_061313 [Homalodisca vitripennis]|nr:hypothetical protein J6590_061313 [Homalodisca vitripennis]